MISQIWKSLNMYGGKGLSIVKSEVVSRDEITSL